MPLPTFSGLLTFLIWAGTRDGPLVIPKVLFEEFMRECTDDSVLLDIRQTEDEYVIFLEAGAGLTAEQVELLNTEPAGRA